MKVLVVDQDDIEKLAAAIRNFLRNPHKGQLLITNALRIFYRNHQATKNARKLWSLIEHIVSR